MNAPKAPKFINWLLAGYTTSPSGTPQKSYWLIDKQVPEAFKVVYKKVIRNKKVTTELSRIKDALHALIDEAGVHMELQDAILSIVESGAEQSDETLIAWLRERALRVQEQIELVQVEKRVYEKMCFDRQVEVQPIINACMSELFCIPDEIKVLQAQINTFDRLRTDAENKYKAAGLSDADIAAIGGVKLTHVDLANWKHQIDAKQARENQINRFFKSAPDYDLSLLEPNAGSDEPVA